ncbi:MAG: hypothetical protein U0736_04300 [Gemmataceae bacterium]
MPLQVGERPHRRHDRPLGVQRERLFERANERGRHRSGKRLDGAAEPAGAAAPRHRVGGLPGVHRRGVVRVGRRVAHPLHHRQQPVAVQPVKRRHARMEAEAVLQLQHLAGAQPQRRPAAGIGVVLVRHHRVQPVVAAGQLNDDEDGVAAAVGRRGGLGARRRNAGGWLPTASTAAPPTAVVRNCRRVADMAAPFQVR